MVRTLFTKTKPIIVGDCYRPPIHQTSYIDHWEEDLCKLRTDYETILLGYFNICKTRKSNPLYKPYMNVLNVFSLCQIIIDPTSVTGDTESTIDHCNFKENMLTLVLLLLVLVGFLLHFVLEKSPGVILKVIILLRLGV